MLNKNRYWSYSLGVLLTIGILVNPVFGEVSNIQTNNEFFLNGEQIEFSGNVESKSTGLVTIVIRDLDEKFVLLTQATINHDDTFQKSVKIEERFTEYGTYTATAFILNMTKGITTKFDVLSDANSKAIDVNTPIKTIEENIDNQTLEKGIIETEENNLPKSKSIYPDFIDSSKNPSHYIERYYSEPTYKSWFDRNYPNMTIEEAVGYSNDFAEIKSTVQNIANNEIIPKAQASSIVKPSQTPANNADIVQISLAMAGLGILFAAVYGVKRQVDSNPRQISSSMNAIREKIIKPITRSSPRDILQVRLAKGEITIDEFEQLEKKLN